MSIPIFNFAIHDFGKSVGALSFASDDSNKHLIKAVFRY